MQKPGIVHTSKPDGKPAILAAGIDSTSRQYLIRALEGQYTVLIAGNCEESLNMLNKHEDSLALIILVIASLNDEIIDILEQAKDDPLLKHIPVIVMSDSRDVEAHALKNGALDFLMLPCPSSEVIRAHVQRTLELSENLNIIRFTERDQLTGLYNKEYFFKYADQFDLYHRDMEMDAVIVNISHFHMINERYGRAYGDDILRHVGERIRQSLDIGIACRRDADAFLVYRPHCDEYETFLRNEPNNMDNQVRLRIGIYPNVDKTLDIERRFDRAKLAADTVRNNFDRTIAFYDDKMRETEIYMEQLLEDFQQGISEKQFVVYYQPKFAIQGTLPVLNSAEALVRWNHPQRGMISPGVFIPLFESDGLIRQLDNYVWREVAMQMRDWKDRLGICVPVSVNMSRVDMLDEDLVDHIKSLVAEFGLNRDEFLLEITETAYTQDSEQIIKTVKAFREAGLKLDMEFMRNAFRERKNTRMLDAVIDIAYSLEVPTIAEGVETAEQMFALKEMGCDIVQGFYFSRPIPAAEFEEFLLEKKYGRRGRIEKDKEEKIKAAEQFAYEALHDPLTGLYNHSAYKMLLKDADQRNIALLLADIDNFTAIEKEYGGETMDSVLELVADVLRHNFRSVDFICRIDDDEFAVIMTRMNNELKSLISDKATRISAMLKERQGDLPPIGLSIGVAFADRPNPQGDIFHDADMALQQVKELKQSGCAIF